MNQLIKIFLFITKVILQPYSKYMDRFFIRIKTAKTPKLEWQFHCYHIIWITCTPMSWFYLSFALNQSSSNVLKLVALISCLTTSAFPVILWFFKSIEKCITGTMIVNFSFQIAGTLYSGGIDSVVLGWNVIYPMTQGFILGSSSLIFWTFVVLLVDVGLLLLKKFNIIFDGGYTETSINELRMGFIFGWLFINFCITYGFLYYRDRNNKKLEDKNQEIEQLIRLLCHDLASPLTVMQISLNQLQLEENEIEEKHLKNQKSLSRAKNALKHATNIIDSVRVLQASVNFDYKLPTKLELINESIQSIVDLFEIKAQQKNIQFRMNITQTKNCYVNVNRQILESEVFANILSNAIKFSPLGSYIDICTFVVDKKIVIEFRDYGIGIPPEMMSHLFNFKIPKSRLGTDGEKGTGFGVALAHNFVEKMNGVIQVFSSITEDQNKGTKFQITFKEESFEVNDDKINK